MTTQYTLSPEEIREAIELWLKVRGLEPKGFIYLGHDPGDPPHGPYVYARFDGPDVVATSEGKK